ncbi:probable RNA 3'-terminal phosphate cyclase-like protein [Tanacetum coccineum]
MSRYGVVLLGDISPKLLPCCPLDGSTGGGILRRILGITNDPKDPSVDTFRRTTLFLKSIGVPAEGLGLKIKNCGIALKDGDKVSLSVPIIHNSLKAVNWTDESMVKRTTGGGCLMFNLQTGDFFVDTHVAGESLDQLTDYLDMHRRFAVWF